MDWLVHTKQLLNLLCIVYYNTNTKRQILGFGFSVGLCVTQPMSFVVQTPIGRTSLFQIVIQILTEQSVSKPLGPVLRRLILVCAVCLCPTKRPLGLYG